MVEIEIEVQCDECGAKLDASVHGNTIYVSPCKCQRDKITDWRRNSKNLNKRRRNKKLHRGCRKVTPMYNRKDYKQLIIGELMNG